MNSAISNLTGNMSAGKFVLSSDFLNTNNLLIKDLSRRSISGGVNIASSLEAGDGITLASMNTMYANAKKDGYTASEVFDKVTAAQIKRIAAHVQSRAKTNLAT